MSKPLYEYEVRVRQIVEDLRIVEATDAESAKEQAIQEFCMDIPDHLEYVTSYVMMWSGSEPTEAEKARDEADAEIDGGEDGDEPPTSDRTFWLDEKGVLCYTEY
jgi:hypothetical protein|tara:strand:+ start:577 stop:891 length:315 start_codon:yes stop_codon:yes gene_type:complete